VLIVEDWAEIRRLRKSEGVSTATVIAERVSWPYSIRTLSGRVAREAVGSVADQLRRLLQRRAGIAAGVGSWPHRKVFAGLAGGTIGGVPERDQDHGDRPSAPYPPGFAPLCRMPRSQRTGGPWSRSQLVSVFGALVEKRDYLRVLTG
jgi:hypothetical protein